MPGNAAGAGAVATGKVVAQRTSIVSTLKQAGWPDALIPEAYAIVIAESGGNANAVNPSSGATGWFQILPSNFAQNGLTSTTAKDPLQNSKAALNIYHQIGFARGWTTYGGSAYKKALSDYQGHPISPSGIANAVTGGASSAIHDIGSFLAAITSPDLWKRIGIGVLGAAMIVVGILLMVGDKSKSLGIPPIIPV